MIGSIGVFTLVLYPSKPDTSSKTWARKKAKEELRNEGISV